ncbi:MAG: hypothetical protein HY401_04290 [Elusimicrobia bacterium]|nr:hypothetical protein [Elusimicrobiota bacterium]
MKNLEKLKRRILDEIKRLASANGGKAPGSMAFESETGIRRHDWYPDLWLRWGDAVAEAGCAPNKFNTAISNEVLIKSYISLIRELKRLPISGELREDFLEC